MSRATRVGFLVDSLLSRYQVRLFNAVRRPAQRFGAVVLGFPGSYLVGADPDRPIFDGSFIFDLVGPECVDGLIVASNVLLSGVGAAKIHAICAHAQVPVVSIGPLPGIPSVDIDNLCGLRRVIEHLVEHHGKRQLAFVRGPLTNPDSVDRERVFRTSLQDMGLEADPDLIVTGNFLEASGAAAVRTLLDERKFGKRVDAIVAANDQMAAGAIRELRLRGLRVPEDLAVVGFDDDEHARSTNPPLTTVAQPICRMGEAAVSMLLDRIAGRTTPTALRLDTIPVWRRSCGCAQGAGFFDEHDASTGDLETNFEERCSTFADQFTRTVGFRNARRGIELALDIVDTRDEVTATQKQHEFEQVVREAASQGVDPLEWEDVLGPLRASKERSVPLDPAQRLDFSIKSQSIHWLLAELSARARLEDQLRTLEYANALRVVGSAVVCARHFRALTRVLDAGLPALDVRFCCVCVFMNGERTRGRVAALYDPAEPKPHDQLHSAEQLWRAIPPTIPPGHFPSSTHLSGFPTNAVLPPSALYTSPKDLLVYPLVFAEDALGYVVVDAPDDVQRAWLLEGLSGHLSSAVYEIARTNELHAARELAEEASSAKSAFVAMMSHEVRTPLNAVIGNVDLCLRTELSREQRRYLERAQTSSRALLSIVNDILDFSRIEAERVEIERLPFELEEVLEQVIVSCSTEAAKKDLELILDVGYDVPFALVGDSLRLMQVLVNLVNNAVKFSSQGHVAVRINAVEADPGAAPRVHFQVEDTGIGMSAAQLERIFKPFTQADNSITRRYGGTGLGLTICQQLVGLLGGELAVQSQPGIGSIFEFSLPLPAATTLPEPQTIDVHAIVAEAHELQGEALSRLLSRYVHSTCLARSGITTLAAVRDALSTTTGLRTVVFVSSQLPDMDGATLSRRVREMDVDHRTSVVLLVPYDAETLLLHGWHQSGVDVVLAKPLQRSSVLRVLERNPGDRPPDSEPAPFPSLRGKRVLVVQDSELSRELARDLLVRSGAEVLFAGDGLEAVTLCEQEALDLVLMDLNLPKLDGCGATRLIRKQPRHAHLPILALSASGDRSDRQRCINAGMDDFIRAPIGASQLVTTIHKWCQPSAPVRLSTFKGQSSSKVRRASAGPAPTLEVARALRRLGGNAALYRKLLQRFVASFEQNWAEWKRAASSDDPRDAAALVHTIVSAAGNIGASRLQQVSQALEASLRSGANALVVVQREHFETEFVEAIEAAKRAVIQPDGTSRPPPSTRLSDVEQRLHSLRRLLSEHDTAAVEVVEALGDVLVEDAQSSEALRRLAQSVASYDFESATLQLDRLTEALKPQASDAHHE
jgi:signal transduction histidine kinase/DNA-binding LacI/PurR family transcriptional regulator/CheY-like chemotaxis protein